MMKGKPEEDGSSSRKMTWTIHSLLSIITRQLPRIKNCKEEEGSIDNNDERSLKICSSKWSEIGDDVFGLILQRLCLTDYLRTQVVCSGWQSVVAWSIANKCCPPLPDLPLIFLQTNEYKSFSFFNLSTKTVLRSTGSWQFHCYGVIQGWLIMVDEYPVSCFTPDTWVRSIIFFNPLTKAKVLMPSRLKCKGRIGKIVASTKPSDPDCVVVCILWGFNKLAIRGMSDESWTLIDGYRGSFTFKEIEILDGKLYALSHPIYYRQFYVFVCDLQNKPIKPKFLAAKIPSLPFDWVSSNLDHPYWFLAADASSGELFLIYTPLSKVFKLNFTRGSEEEEEAEWIEVKDLGNRTLFVGGRKSLVISNVGVHGPQDLIKENCVYFTCEVRNHEKSKQWKLITFGRYYCESDQKKDYYTYQRFIPSMVSSPTWFVPSL